MSIRNTLLANELAKVILPSTHQQMVENPEHVAGASFRRVLEGLETCLAAHNKTNFTDVCAFNELIGNGFGQANLEQIKRQIELIESEFKELIDGYKAMAKASAHLAEALSDEELALARSEIEEARIAVRDGIADVLVTTYGLAHRMGIDADSDMLAVSTSNASKFFVGVVEEAAKVCKALADTLGIKVEMRKAMFHHAATPADADEDEKIYVWAFVSADDSDPERPRGKLLKAPGYKPPVFL